MGAELVIADLTNGADVVRALRGCKRMFFGMSISPPYLQATAISGSRNKEIPHFEILMNISQMTVSQISLTEMTQSIQAATTLARGATNQRVWSACITCETDQIPATPPSHGILINRQRWDN